MTDRTTDQLWIMKLIKGVEQEKMIDEEGVEVTTLS